MTASLGLPLVLRGDSSQAVHRGVIVGENAQRTRFGGRGTNAHAAKQVVVFSTSSLFTTEESETTKQCNQAIVKKQLRQVEQELIRRRGWLDNYGEKML